MSEPTRLAGRVKVSKGVKKIPVTRFCRRTMNATLKRVLNDARLFPAGAEHVIKKAEFNTLAQEVIPLLAKLVDDVSAVTSLFGFVARCNDAGMAWTSYYMIPLAHKLLRYLVAHPNAFPPGLPPLDIDFEKQGFWSINKETLQPVRSVSTTDKPDTWIYTKLRLGSLVINKDAQTRYADYNWGRSEERVELQECGHMTRFLWHVRVGGWEEEEGLAVQVATLKQPLHQDNISGFIQSWLDAKLHYSAYDGERIQSWTVDRKFNTDHEPESIVAVIALTLGWSDMRIFLDLQDSPATLESERKLSKYFEETWEDEINNYQMSGEEDSDSWEDESDEERPDEEKSEKENSGEEVAEVEATK